MKAEHQIDFEKIIAKAEKGLSDYDHWETKHLIFAMREAATEAIRLAAPLFAEEAKTKTKPEFGRIHVDKDSIIDAVPSVTKTILGE